MSVPILELVDVHAGYGRIEVLSGVDLRIPKGAVVAMLGPNGAGKSTLLKVISGQLRPTSGDVHMAGVAVSAARPDQLARAGLTTIPEGRGIFPNLSVRDNLSLMSYAGVPRRQVLDTAYSFFPRLHERRHQLAGRLSGGEQQMLALSRALTSDPALLLLDELSMGLAPLVVQELYDAVGQIAASGVSILLVEQFARTALRVADHAVVMSGGRIVGRGDPDDVETMMAGVLLGGAS